MFWAISLRAARASMIASGRRSSWLPMRATSAVSIAASLPAAPMAIPMDAFASAGASFTPSPTIATIEPSRRRSSMCRSLLSGLSDAWTSPTPTASATRAAAASWSPVSITTRFTPIADNRSIAARARSRGASSSRTAPAISSSTSSTATDAPWFRHAEAMRATSPSSRLISPTTLTARPPTTPRTPEPSNCSTSSASASASPRARAAPTIASASGCETPDSKAAASASTWSSVCPGAQAIAVTLGTPSVRVPVLSIAIVRTRASVSRCPPPLMSTPSCADRLSAHSTAAGVPIASAHGEAAVMNAIDL